MIKKHILFLLTKNITIQLYSFIAKKFRIFCKLFLSGNLMSEFKVFDLKNKKCGKSSFFIFLLAKIFI